MTAPSRRPMASAARHTLSVIGTRTVDVSEPRVHAAGRCLERLAGASYATQQAMTVGFVHTGTMPAPVPCMNREASHPNEAERTRATAQETRQRMTETRILLEKALRALEFNSQRGADP